MSDEASELPIVPTKRGNQDPRDPVEGRGYEPGVRIAGGKDEEDTDPRQRLNETAADSRAGAEGAADGHTYAGPSHRRGVSPRGLPTDAEGRGGRRGRPDGGGLRGEPGGQPPVAARPLQVRHVLCAAGPTRRDPQGGRDQTSPR